MIKLLDIKREGYNISMSIIEKTVTLFHPEEESKEVFKTINEAHKWAMKL